jgi:hypothetical protein
LIGERDVDVAWVSTDPEAGWQYQYALPDDLLAPRYLSYYSRFALASNHANENVLLTNQEDAILIYSKRQEVITLWDPSLRLAIVYALAAHICMPLNAKPNRAEYAQSLANKFITDARVNMANAEQEQFESVPDWLIARGYGGVNPSTRYVYEMGPMVAVTDGIGHG